jgi:hypothetical protein
MNNVKWKVKGLRRRLLLNLQIGTIVYDASLPVDGIDIFVPALKINQMELLY